MSGTPVMNNAVSAPDSRSSREAELEELRQKSLAQQNAQKLGTYLVVVLVVGKAELPSCRTQAPGG